MEKTDFQTFFQRGSGFDPFPYQVRLAEAQAMPLLVNAPTGAGKTLAVLGAWLWRHTKPDGISDTPTPRRLVYCLPLRTLVNQTLDEVGNFIEGVGLSSEVSVYSMMGGEAEEEWVLRPEEKCVIVGTQDMLLSRALNRGYAQSRYAWPRSFGLLNNDCLWVFDEVFIREALEKYETSAKDIEVVLTANPALSPAEIEVIMRIVESKERELAAEEKKDKKPE